MTTSTDAYAALRLERLHTAPPDEPPAPRGSDLPPSARAKMREVIAGIEQALNDDRKARATERASQLTRLPLPPITTRQVINARILRSKGHTWSNVGAQLGINPGRISAAVRNADRHIKERTA